jgi:hypothetical protein
MIVILNGPPGSGKDTIANLIAETTENWMHLMFKEQLYYDVCKVYDVPLKKAMPYFTDRKKKEKHTKVFGGLTPRGALIHVSEKIIKPMYGLHHYGAVLADRILNEPDHMNYIISDGGFVAEMKVMLQMVEGIHEVVIVQLRREGCTYEGDSRNYVNDFPSITFQLDVIENNVAQTIDELWDIILDMGGTYVQEDDGERDDTPFMTEDEPEEIDRI